MESDGKIPDAMLPAEHTTTAAPAPPGRPWAKGQSGNPLGRPRAAAPSRAHKAASVAQALYDRKTPDLVDRAIGWAQGGDKTMLRAYLNRLVPPRSEVPVWLGIPPIETSRDVYAALRAIGTGVAHGHIASAQGLRLVRLYTEILRFL